MISVPLNIIKSFCTYENGKVLSIKFATRTLILKFSTIEHAELAISEMINEIQVRIILKSGYYITLALPLTKISVPKNQPNEVFQVSLETNVIVAVTGEMNGKYYTNEKGRLIEGELLYKLFDEILLNMQLN